MDRADRIRRNSGREEQSDEDNSAVAIVLGILGHAGLLGGGLFLLPVMFTVTGTALPPELLLALFAAVMGGIPAYLLQNSISFKSYSTVAIAESCVIALIAGFNAAIYQTFQQLQRFEQQLGATNHTTGSSIGSNALSSQDSMAIVNMDAAVHPEVFFFTTLLLFNAPFIYYFMQRRDTDWRYLGLYALPLLLYVGVRLLIPALLSGTALSGLL